MREYFRERMAAFQFRMSTDLTDEEIFGSLRMVTDNMLQKMMMMAR
jgi:hypothetical protein